MAAFNFPNSPNNGDTYTANGVTFVYDSTNGAWKKNPASATKGQKGATGADNSTKGQKGVKGATGADNSTKGQKGATGADNSTKGQKGATGADNSTKGQKGATGPQGNTGPQGAQGIKGQKGEIGPQGPQGEKGATGAKGDKGAVGPQGPQGAQGPTGPTSFNGSIRQLTTATKTGAWSYRYYTGTQDVGMLASITPNDNSNKLLVRFFVYCGGQSASQGYSRIGAYLQRKIGSGSWNTVFTGNQAQGTIPLIPSVPGGPSNNTYTYLTAGVENNSNQAIGLLAHEFLDEPTTTQQVQYRVLVYGANHGGSYANYLTLGRSYTSGWGSTAQCPCSITVMELES